MARPRLVAPITLLVLAAALLSAGCGSSGSTSSAGPPPGSSTDAGAPVAEAEAAAAGDIPDNQVFLTFTNDVAGYSLQYPEGWAQQGDGADVSFRDKTNIVHIVVTSGAAPTAASVAAALATDVAAGRGMVASPPTTTTVGAQQVAETTYTTTGAADPVTGKTVNLTVDRYVFGDGAHVATLDLGTPAGVDNVDAYRQIMESFRWMP